MDQEIEQLREHYDKSMQKAREWGLEPFEIDFHVVPAEKMYEIASFGVPGHFSHWTYGRDYWMQKSSYDYGRSKIYELIINADPAQAFLLENNSLLENMFVISHCIGHSDVFANNVYFAHTNRSIEHSVSSLADHIRDYEIQHGRKTVEDFIDRVFTIKEHIDPHLRTRKKELDYKTSYEDHPYEDLFPEAREERESHRSSHKERSKRFPHEPERDLLRFIGEHGRLEDWQRDIVFGIREEMVYFLPQYQTKILNEGWACIIHNELMHEIDPDADPGGIQFSNLHSSVVSKFPGQVNPYFLGYKLFKRIIELHGWEKALEVREIDSDETFLRNYLDEEVCEELDLFVAEHRESQNSEWWKVTSKDWEVARDTLVSSKENMGFPYIVVTDGDYQNAGKLLLRQEDEKKLDTKYARETLKTVEKLWGRPVYLDAYNAEEGRIIYQCENGVVRTR